MILFLWNIVELWLLRLKNKWAEVKEDIQLGVTSPLGDTGLFLKDF